MRPPSLKLLAFFAATVFLFSCSTSRFSSKRYGHRDWIKVDYNQQDEQADNSTTQIVKDEINTVEKVPEVKSTLVKNEIVTENNLAQLKDIQEEISSGKKIEEQKNDTEKLQVTEGRLSVISPPADPLVKKLAKKINASTGSNVTSDVDLILIVLLAILIPPLGVYLFDGTSTMFWITLILCLLGGPLWFIGSYFVSLWGISVILAVLYVLEII